MRYKADARTEEYEHVTLFGKPALFTSARISSFTVPDGWRCYELRGSDYDPGDPIMVEDHVVVNHAGSVLMPADLKLESLKEHRRRIGDQLLFLGETLTLQQFCDEHGLEFPADHRKFAPIPAQIDQKQLFYSLPTSEDERIGCVGHLRMDFGRNGKEFWTSWFEHGTGELTTPEFIAELNDVVNELRETVLKDRANMRMYCAEFGGDLGENLGVDQYGYVIDTEDYQYCLRCKPMEGDYDGYLYCYDKRVQQQMSEIQTMVLEQDDQFPSPTMQF